jgi:methionyl-tRNA formyltransferase
VDTALPLPPAQPRRLVYLGSPEVAVRPLQALVEAGFEIPLVVSRPDRRRGRGGALSPSPVKAAAQRLAIPTSDDVNDAAAVGADLGVVVAYGRLIKPDLLQQLPFVNLHFSLLPRWRGAAPVERALLAGDEVTGVCVMAMEEGLDTGGVYRQAEVAITEEDTLEGLRRRLVDLGVELLLDCLRNGFGPPLAQQGEALYAAKLDPAELELDWTQPASRVVRTVALGRAWTTFRGKRLLVHKAVARPATGPASDRPAPGEVHAAGSAVLVGTAEGLVELRVVQPEGRARQDAAAWRNGARPRPGERVGERLVEGAG